MITPTQHEKNEWSRLATDAYKAGANQIGHRYSAAAATMNGQQISTARYDALQGPYRAWLIDGTMPSA